MRTTHGVFPTDAALKSKIRCTHAIHLPLESVPADGGTISLNSLFDRTEGMFDQTMSATVDVVLRHRKNEANLLSCVVTTELVLRMRGRDGADHQFCCLLSALQRCHDADESDFTHWEIDWCHQAITEVTCHVSTRCTSFSKYTLRFAVIITKMSRLMEPAM